MATGICRAAHSCLNSDFMADVGAGKNSPEKIFLVKVHRKQKGSTYKTESNPDVTHSVIKKPKSYVYNVCSIISYNFIVYINKLQ